MRVRSLVMIVVVILVAVTGAFASVPNYINFQGTLTDTSGSPITGDRSMQFFLYDDTLSSSQLWDEFYPVVPVRDGLFRVQLGSVISLPPSLFDGRVMWLGILVGSDPQELYPRFPIVTTPYSFRSNNADVALNANLAFYALFCDSANYADEAGVAAIAGHALTSDTSGYAHTAGVAGDAIHSVYSDTAIIAVHAGTAGDAYHSTYSDTAVVSYVAGWANDGLHSLYSDTANYAHAAAPDNDWGTSGSNIYRYSGNVGVGTAAPAHKFHVEGQAIAGINSWASGLYNTISGGEQCSTSGSWSTVCGGKENSAMEYYATVAGGFLNKARGRYDFVGGGLGNIASGWESMVGGGYFNEASGDYSTVGGGVFNVASGSRSTVAGGGQTQVGLGNSASNNGTFIGGGQANEASGLFATVGGGNNNTASSGDAVVAGGCDNYATGRRSAIPGGFDNAAYGSYSFAAGQHAKAYHDGCFVWADSSNADFASTNINQFLVRATGGVGIGYTNPTHQLTVCSSSDDQTLRLIGPYVNGHGGKLNFGDNNYVYLKEDLDDKLTMRADRIGMIGGNVGIGTVAPDRLLHLYGDANPRLLIEAPSTQTPEINIQRGTTTYALYVNSGNDLVFYQAGDRMKLTDGGDVGIGIGTPGYKLDVGGHIQCVALHETSDLRFKTNIRPLEHALDTVTKLRGISFEWNEEAESVGATPGDHQIGLVAQEVERVIPELVSTPENGYKSLDYTKLTAVLIEAVKEQQEMIEELRAEIEELKR